MTYKEQIEKLLADPNQLKMKKPFTRGADRSKIPHIKGDVGISEMIDAVAPMYMSHTVTQEQYMNELDPNCHDVLFDENIPSLCLKLSDGSYQDVRFEKMPVPIQRNIKNKQVLHLTGNKMQFTLMDTAPTDAQVDIFTTFKQYWDLRNQDGMKTKMVDKQLSYGDAGLLYYFDYKGRIKSRILSYDKGYVLCPHNDQNGDRILESVYYMDGDTECIDSYDDTFMYKHRRTLNTDNSDNDGWTLTEVAKHGFNEIPLVTKRGKVAWDNVQNMITSYEILYNIFNGIQRNFGWGILYIKGRFSQDARKIAGNVVLNDTSLEGKGDARFLTPPRPEGTIETLNLMLDSIQLGSSTTFLLPKDIHFGGDISGIAIQLTQGLDLENAEEMVIEYQNVANKMTRLFLYGLAVELVNSGDPRYKNAITEFQEININAKFKVWRPMNEMEYNQMLTTLVGAGLISRETGTARCTESAPDENARLEKQKKEEEAAQKKAMMQSQNQPMGNQQNTSQQNKIGGEE